MDQQTFSVSPNMSCSRRRERTQQQKQTQWPSKRGRLQWSEDKNDGTAAENGPCGACMHVFAQRAAVRGTSLTKVWLKTPSRVPLSVQMKKQKKKTKIKCSRLPVGKVLAAASQEANSQHLTSFEWCDYVWSGPWQVVAPLCGCLRATNPRQQD